MHTIGMDVDRTFDVVITEDEDGWFVASVPALHGCLTQGRTRAQALERIKESILLWLESGKSPDLEVRSVTVESVSVEG